MTSSNYVTDSRLGCGIDGLEGISTNTVIERALDLFDDDERTENLRWNVYTGEIAVWDINVDVDKEFDVVEFVKQVAVVCYS